MRGYNRRGPNRSAMEEGSLKFRKSVDTKQDYGKADRDGGGTAARFRSEELLKRGTP